CYRLVPGQLEPAQDQQADEVSRMEAVGGRIASVIQRNRPTFEQRRQLGTVGRVVDEATRLEVFDDRRALPWRGHKWARLAIAHGFHDAIPTAYRQRPFRATAPSLDARSHRSGGVDRDHDRLLVVRL